MSFYWHFSTFSLRLLLSKVRVFSSKGVTCFFFLFCIFHCGCMPPPPSYRRPFFREIMREWDVFSFSFSADGVDCKICATDLCIAGMVLRSWGWVTSGVVYSVLHFRSRMWSREKRAGRCRARERRWFFVFSFLWILGHRIQHCYIQFRLSCAGPKGYTLSCASVPLFLIPTRTQAPVLLSSTPLSPSA